MFEVIERPEKNRRKATDDLNYDLDIETALLDTLNTRMAIKLPLWQFHSSPAKGRLWKEGLSVRHRVLGDRQTVAAWIETKEET